MKNKIFLLFGIVLLLSVRCADDPWDTRFEGNIIPADKTVWEIISENSEYQGFVALLQETGVDTILKRNSVFTVLVPSSEAIAQIQDSSIEVKTQAVKYQISNGLIYSTEMPLGKKLLTISGKSLLFEKIGDKIMVNKDAKVVTADIRASNGVIHETDKIQLVKPNILEIIYDRPEYSYIADFFSEATTRTFDIENSIPVGINEFGLTIYDSVWIQTNPFFTQNGNLGSEFEQFAIFLADNTILDTTQAGGLKIGYISKLAGFIVKGNINPLDLPDYLISADGSKIELTEGSYEFLENSSNGPVFVIKDLNYYTVPKKLTWEITRISDFDSIRGIKSYDYRLIYSQLTQVTFKDISAGGGFTNLRYEIITGPLNRDHFKIIPTSRTSVTMDMKLPDIVPGKYKITLRAIKRVADGALFDVYLNNTLVKLNISLNGGNYDWADFDLGDAVFTFEQNNILTFKIKGTDPSKRQIHFDYLTFEPIN